MGKPTIREQIELAKIHCPDLLKRWGKPGVTKRKQPEPQWIKDARKEIAAEAWNDFLEAVQDAVRKMNVQDLST